MTSFSGLHGGSAPEFGGPGAITSTSQLTPGMFGPEVQFGGMTANINPANGNIVIDAARFGLPSGFVEINAETGQTTVTIDTPGGVMQFGDFNTAMGLFGPESGFASSPGEIERGLAAMGHAAGFNGLEGTDPAESATGGVTVGGPTVGGDFQMGDLNNSPAMGSYAMDQALAQMGHAPGFNGLEGSQTQAERAQGLREGRSKLGGPTDDGDDADGVTARELDPAIGAYQNELDAIAGAQAERAAASMGTYGNEMESANSAYGTSQNNNNEMESSNSAWGGPNAVTDAMESARGSQPAAAAPVDPGQFGGAAPNAFGFSTQALGEIGANAAASQREAAHNAAWGNIGDDAANAFDLGGNAPGTNYGGENAASMGYGGGDVGVDIAAGGFGGDDGGGRTGGFAQGAFDGMGFGVSGADIAGANAFGMGMDGAAGGRGMGGYGIGGLTQGEIDAAENAAQAGENEGYVGGLESAALAGAPGTNSDIGREAERGGLDGGGGFAGIGENAFGGVNTAMDSNQTSAGFSGLNGNAFDANTNSAMNSSAQTSSAVAGWGSDIGSGRRGGNGDDLGGGWDFGGGGYGWGSNGWGDQAIQGGGNQAGGWGDFGSDIDLGWA